MAGLSLSLLVVLGIVAWTSLDDPYVAPTPPSPTVRVQPTEAGVALQELQEAVSTRDGVGAATLAADDESGRLLQALADNARRLRVVDFSLRYVDETGALRDDGSWDAAVDVTWRFRGFDRAPARTEVRFGFVTEGDRVLVASIGGGDRHSPVWMTGPVEVRRTPRTLVLADRPPAETDRYAREARRAVPAVRAVLPGWRPRLVIEVPASAAGLHQALASDPGQYVAIAAVTSTVDGSLAPDAPVHVFLNPAVFGDLRPQGAQVVMTHEAVHVATDAATSTLPLWLLEGFADHVALREVHLPLSVTARQILRQVRRDGVPRHLPGSAEFDTTTSHLGAAYESAWLACRLLAELRGTPALVRLYERVGDGRPLGATLRDEFGFGEAGLTRLWQQELRELAG